MKIFLFILLMLIAPVFSYGNIEFNKVKINKAKIGIVSPDNIKGKELWLDASDISTITLVGGYVSVWRDKSGNNHNAIQGEAIRRPFYDTDGRIYFLNFDGTSDVLNITSPWSSEITLFLVTTKSIGGSDDVILKSDGEGSSPFVWSQWSSRAFEWYNTASERKTIKSTTNNNLHLITVVRKDFPGILKCYFDGEITVNSSSASVNDLQGLNMKYIGSSGLAYFANINVGEIIVFNRILLDSERQQIEYYLMSKWGL